jgi:hypothetical protein
MPGRDGTGPMGRGVMSGRGLGVCNGANVGGYGIGLGCRTGRGRGAGYGCMRGFGRFNIGERTVLTEKELLTEQKEQLESRIDIISKRLDNLSEADS